MSSESDVEEFFDAQDVTPVVVRTVAAHASEARVQAKNEGSLKQGNYQVASLPLDDLEEERRRLLEKQKLAEERRRKEEEEIHKQLAEIERRKVEEAERKKVDERRKKLEELRISVDSNLTPQRPQVRQLSPSSPHCLSTPHVDRIGQETTMTSAHRRSSEAEDVVQTTNSSLPDRVSSEASIQSRLPDNFMNTNDTINRNRPMNIDVDKARSKNIPEVVIDYGSRQSVTSANVTRRNNDDDDDVDSAALADDEISSFEPDIVQSTKARSLNRLGQLAPSLPVAPPRKKKVQSVGPGSDSLPNLVRPHSEGDDAFTKVINLTQEPESSVGMPGTEDGSEPTLDINSATKGNRVVTVIEDRSAKGDPGKEEHDSPDSGGPLRHKSSKELLKEEGTTGKEPHMVRLTPEMIHAGKVAGEDYSVNVTRPRSSSGSRFLTDTEILDQVFVLNLDTGETVPLSSAEEKLPKCINPLSLHIMRRTKEYSSDSNLYKGDQSDDEALKDSNGPRTVKTVKPLRKRKLKLKKFFKTKLKGKIKSAAGGGGHGEDSASDDEDPGDGRSMIKVKASHSNKGPYEFDMLVPIQDLSGQCSGAVWTMKFSHCGRLLATGGQDNLLRVWVLKDAFSYFNDMRQKYNEASTRVSPAPSQDSLNSQNDGQEPTKPEEEEEAEGPGDDEDAEYLPFMKQPFCTYRGHMADLLDISWSKNYFILSSSMDKTVRLWHISRRECLCCFQHIDFVTAIAFHPKDDRYFLSGSLDGKLRLWNIPDKKVALWNEVSSGTKLITAANFCLNGRFAVVGTYDGRCVFYSTEQLKYYTQIHVRSTRGKNARGRKITGVEPFPGEDKILVTSNDSRIRLYDLRDLTLTCKYKGCANNSSQIKASFSHDGKFIICGSEDHYVYIWKTQHDFYKFHSARRDRNDFWEGIKAHSAVVTNAIFAPNPLLIIKPQFQYIDMDDKENTEAGQGEVLVSADYSGLIKIFINKFKPGN